MTHDMAFRAMARHAARITRSAHPYTPGTELDLNAIIGRRLPEGTTLCAVCGASRDYQAHR